ncbi:MAG: acyltransferase [Butyrivibrio sp.]|nr:acyltransferase [Butyrivibrio sp.]
MEKQRKEIKNTLGMFDLLKGIIIIIMILSHTTGLMDFLGTYPTATAFLEDYSFPALVAEMTMELFAEAAMPIMMILGGYGFRKTTFKKCLKKQYKTIIIPYIITVAVTLPALFIMATIFDGGWKKAVRTTAMMGIGFGLGMPQMRLVFGHMIGTSGPFWFLIALVVGSLVFNQLLHRFEGKKLLLASFGVACLGWVIGLLGPLPLCMAQSLEAVLYLCMGYFAKKEKIFTAPLDKENKLTKFLPVFIPIIAAKCFASQFNMALNYYTYGPISIVFHGIMGMFIIHLFLRINNLNGFINTFLRKVGRLSLYVLCVHTVELIAGGAYFAERFKENWTGDLLLRSAILFGVRAVIVLVATYVFVALKDYFQSKKING